MREALGFGRSRPLLNEACYVRHLGVPSLLIRRVVLANITCRVLGCSSTKAHP